MNTGFSLIVLVAGLLTATIAIFSFKKTFYVWILLAGAIGIPVLVVRQSHLMFSELFLAPLLLLWVAERKLKLRLLNLPALIGDRTKIEKSLWFMIYAFIVSSVFNLIVATVEPSIGGAHSFVMAKLMALFLYVAPVLTAIVVADLIRSFEDVRKISMLLISLGLFTLITELQKDGTFLKEIQSGIGWQWMSVTILFAFCLSQLLFDTGNAKKLVNTIVCSAIAMQIFKPFFLGTATYKAVIVANFAVVFTLFYFKSKKLAFMTLAATVILTVAVLGVFSRYIVQETQEGSWGSRGSSRIAVWKLSLLVFLENPIVGVGPYNYYDHALYVASKTQNGSKTWGVMTSPHGQYFQILAETGIVGAIAFSWFFVELLKVFRFFLGSQSTSPKFKVVFSAISAILVSRLATGFLGDYVIADYHNAGLQTFSVTVYFWVSLGVLIALNRLLIEETSNNMDQCNSIFQVPEHHCCCL